jgi:CheY-like chemotaxis protein
MNQQRRLIVYDEEPMRRLIATNLKASGYRITTAADGNEALQLLDERQFDLLLLDINMPDRTVLLRRSARRPGEATWVRPRLGRALSSGDRSGSEAGGMAFVSMNFNSRHTA